MIDLIFSPWTGLLFFACSVVLMVLGLNRKSLVLTVSGILCTILTCIQGLLIGRSLTQLLIAVLVPALLVLYSLQSPEGGEES